MGAIRVSQRGSIIDVRYFEIIDGVWRHVGLLWESRWESGAEQWLIHRVLTVIRSLPVGTALFQGLRVEMSTVERLAEFVDWNRVFSNTRLSDAPVRSITA